MPLQKITLLPILLSATCALAQTTLPPDAFTHALELRKAYHAAVGMQPGPGHWIGDTNSVWFERTDGEKHEYTLYDVTTGASSTLDKTRIAAAVNHSADQAKLPVEPVQPEKLWLPQLTFDADGKGFTFDMRRGHVHCALPQYDCAVASPHEPGAEENQAPGFEGNDPHRIVFSPDGQWEATIQNFNVFLHRKGAPGPAVPLSHEGTAGDYYQRSSLQWSPDSRHLLASRVLQGMRRQVTYVESSPESQLQPITSSRFYAKPGDVLDREQPVSSTRKPPTRSSCRPISFPTPTSFRASPGAKTAPPSPSSTTSAAISASASCQSTPTPAPFAA